MKRYLSLLALLLITLLMITACGGDPSTNADPALTTEPVPETDPVPATLDIVQNGVANYTIIRGEKANSETVSAATMLFKAFNEHMGIIPEFTTDWIKPGSSYDSTSLEILVGDTGYSESAEALKDLPYGDYIIKPVGNKLVINAWSTSAVDDAVHAFTEEMIKSATQGNFSIPADYCKTGTVIQLANALPAYGNTGPSVVYHAGDDNQLLIFEETTEAAYNDYRKALENAGYTLYTDNKITDNTFATYINDDYVVNAGYYRYQDSVRVIIEPRKNLPGLAADNKYTAKVTPSFAMLGVEFPEGDGSLSQNGLCFIYQLADGSYIIIDGGFNRDTDAQNIYKYMHEHAPDKNNITVAAWIFTHAHGDHNGAFFKFSPNYGSKVNVELVIGNFPSDETREAGGLGTEGSGGAKIMNYTKEYHKNAKFIKAHVGQKFFLRDAEIEILYTLESYSPGVLDYFNTSSLIFTVKIAGQQFLILGDASNIACTVAHSMYGSYLKSDIIHVAHHGYTTGSSSYKGVTDVYDDASAPVVFWPVGNQDFPGMSSRAYDAHLQKLASTKEIIVAGSRQVRIMLPYTYGTSGYETILK